MNKEVENKEEEEMTPLDIIYRTLRFILSLAIIYYGIQLLFS